MEKPLFAKNLNYLRRQVNLTRQQAADRAGIPVGSWSSYEEGRAFPHHDRLPAICHALQFFDVLAIIEKDLSTEEGNRDLKQVQATETLRKMDEMIKRVLYPNKN